MMNLPELPKTRKKQAELLAARLKAARKVLGLTQAEAAEAWGLPMPTLRAWECGDRLPTAFFQRLLLAWLAQVEGPPLTD